MDVEDIKMQLSRYYEGASSLADERMLVEYFASEQDVPEELEADKRMFQALVAAGAGMSAGVVPAGLERRMAEFVDALERRHRRRNVFKAWSAAAAAVLLLVGGGVIWNSDRVANVNAASDLTNEEVCHYTESSLRMLVSTLGRGTSESVEAQEILLNTTATALEKVEKSL